MALNIQVCLRVRPLTSREASVDQRLSLSLPDSTKSAVFLQDISEEDASSWNPSPPPRQFTFDYCFWSVDPSCPRFASQDQVFDRIGLQVLDALLDGYNACVLAYGQSGTGKTYTMMGNDSEPGLAPRLCSALFERFSALSKGQHPPSIRIDVSFMEIYNEKVRDLLEDYRPAAQSSSPRRNHHRMRVREHPKFGPYVQDLSSHSVEDASAALDLLSYGMRRRTSAATHSNRHSSRSHAVFSVHCTKAFISPDGTPRETSAKLHLVDLAGSERANRELVSRLRLKEGSLINKSLAALGNVINALAERSGGSSHQLRSSSSSTCSSSAASSPRRTAVFVPYRDSVLTWILKDSLGGNSRTFVIATVSPSARAFKETLSTLRFAQRAKHIVNRPVVNEDVSVKLIRHLREEVSRLKAILAQSVIRPEAIEDLVTANQSKAQELTEDWLQKWQSGSTIIDTIPPRSSSDIAVQTSPFGLEMEDERENHPAPTDRPFDDSPDGNASYEDEDLEDEEENWSDDSLEGSYPTVIVTTEVDSLEEEEGGIAAAAARSPSSVPIGRIRSRKTPPKPDVRTIFTSSRTNTEEPTESRTMDLQVSGNKEGSTSLPDGPALMARLSSLIRNLSVNNNNDSANNRWNPKSSPNLHHTACCCHRNQNPRPCFHRRHQLDIDMVIKNELLAIRRRLVARTASKKVLDSLPYLAQWGASE